MPLDPRGNRKGALLAVLMLAVAGCSSNSAPLCPTSAAKSMLADSSGQTIAVAVGAHASTERERALAAAFWVLMIKSSHDGTADPILVTSGLADAVAQGASNYPTLFQACTAGASTSSALTVPRSSADSTTFTCEQSCLPKLSSFPTANSEAIDKAVGLLTKGTEYAEVWELYTNTKTAVESAENKHDDTVEAIASSMKPAESAWVLNTLWNTMQGVQAAAKIAVILGAEGSMAVVASDLGVVVASMKAVLIVQELKSSYATYRDCSAYMHDNCNCTPACGHGFTCMTNSCVACVSDGYCSMGCGECCNNSDCPAARPLCTSGTCYAQACDSTSCPSPGQCVDGCGNINPTFCSCGSGASCTPGGACQSTSCVPSSCPSPGMSCLDNCGGINPTLCGCGTGACLPNGSCPTPGCATPDCQAWSEGSDGGTDGGSCGTDSFRCGNGHCIPAGSVCNGVSDCADGSDENSSLCSDPHSCCVATNGCPGETGESCAASCCCCGGGEACCADKSGCCPAP